MASTDGIVEEVRALRTLDDPQEAARLLIEYVTALRDDPTLARRVVLDVVDRRAVPRSIDEAQLRTLSDASGLPAEVIEQGIAPDQTAAISRLLKIGPPRNADPLARNAATKTGADFAKQLATYPHPRLTTRGITGTVERVTQRLNAIRLDDTRLLVLSDPNVYERVFLSALDDGNVSDDDVTGIVDYIQNHVDDSALPSFLANVVAAVVDAAAIAVTDEERDDIVRLALVRGLRITSGQLKPAVLELVEVEHRQGKVPRYLQMYLSRHKFADTEVDDSIQQAMIDYLVGLGVQMTFDDVAKGEDDELFAVALAEARRQRSTSDDPIDIARNGNRLQGQKYSFTIRRMSERGAGLVRPDAVRAAGMLWVTFVEGELMRLFDLADSIDLAWMTGQLDVSEGPLANLLYRYDQMRSVRLNDEERGMMYRRLLGFGEAATLPGMLINDGFGQRIDNLMYEVTRLVDLQDRAFSDPRQISRSGVSAAITALQYNLSQYVTGSAFLKINEMYKQLEEAQDLIADPIVVTRYGGAEQTFTSTVKNLGLRFLQTSIPTEDLLELAECGYDVFEYIAEFTPGTIREESFQQFLESARKTIIARAAIGDGGWSSSNGEGSAAHDGDQSLRSDLARVRPGPRDDMDDWDR